jgi:hypothetical protein
MEKEIKIAAKLYKCRDTAKQILGAKYQERLEPYIALIKTVMRENKIEELPALLIISKTKIYEDGFNQLYFMAAVCEIIEPSK